MTVPPRREIDGGGPGGVSGDAVSFGVCRVEELRPLELTVRLVMHLHDLPAIP
ncbi:MAG TPA: hypothetical protein VFN75_11460 [Pseudonocardiaceae bacterium]|nr:hypothetical protein [Pseudonocardiaceae bacterium]